MASLEGDKMLIPNITFSAINCNSLNSSTISSLHHKLKIYGISKLKTDVIFLSDIRLQGKNSFITENLKKSFLCNPYGQYEFFFNSEKSSRGVGILINKKITFVIEEELRDKNHNILALSVTIQGKKCFLVSIYGPNKICDDFFVDLDSILAKSNGKPVVVGGDWNLTPSPLPPALNPDVLNMQRIPNEKHTRQLQSLQLKYSLVDAFRVLYPNRKEFSYIPRDKSKDNRSRIDFFLMSRNCIVDLAECSIYDTLQSKLFDHRAISLSFVKKSIRGAIETISPVTVNNPLTEYIVGLSYNECYLLNGNFKSVEEVNFQKNCLITIGRARKILREISQSIISASNSQEIPQESEASVADIRATLHDLETLGIDSIQICVENDTFLDVLINHLRNDVLSYQRFLTKSKCQQKKKTAN
jgi:exonuclease III